MQQCHLPQPARTHCNPKDANPRAFRPCRRERSWRRTWCRAAAARRRRRRRRCTASQSPSRCAKCHLNPKIVVCYSCGDVFAAHQQARSTLPIILMLVTVFVLVTLMRTPMHGTCVLYERLFFYVDRFTISVQVDEKLIVRLNKDGGMENMEIQGTMSLMVSTLLCMMMLCYLGCPLPSNSSVTRSIRRGSRRPNRPCSRIRARTSDAKRQLTVCSIVPLSQVLAEPATRCQVATTSHGQRGLPVHEKSVF